MPCVSNTSPLFNLAMIGQLQLLENHFGEIIIPAAVIEELAPVWELPAIDAVKQALDEQWIRRVVVRDQETVRELRLDLDYGESEAIALALELGFESILLDVTDGRRVARQMGLKPIGALGVLLRAKKQGQLTSVKEAMIALQEEATFYIADRLFQDVLKMAGES